MGCRCCISLNMTALRTFEKPWVDDQGNRILCLKHLEEVLLIQRSAEALGIHTPRARFLAEEIEGKMPQHRNVGRGVAQAYPAVILAQRHVQHPMDTLFNTPMSPHGVGNRAGTRCPTDNVGASLVCWCTGAAPFRLDQADARVFTHVKCYRGRSSSLK